jgi:hypothetical protein
MPQLVKVQVAKGFKPETEADKKAMAAAQKAGVVEMDYVTAMENIRNGNGLYELVTGEPGPSQAPGPRALEDMSSDELKVMMLTTGIRPQKQMTRAEVIKSIRIKLAEVEIADEG